MASGSSSLETMWKNGGLVFEDIRMFFLCPLTSIHVKEDREPYFLTPLLITSMDIIVETVILFFRKKY
jgi:hypothetical protein